MAWTSDSKVLDNVAPTQVPLHHAVPPFPFNAALFPLSPTIPEPVDQRELDREAIKQNLRDIMTNRFFSETARVAAARELARVIDNEELVELREQVKELVECLVRLQPNEEDLPTFLRRKK
jgi:hypothetical protein